MGTGPPGPPPRRTLASGDLSGEAPDARHEPVDLIREEFR
jgi:hypothetical protein